MTRTRRLAALALLSLPGPLMAGTLDVTDAHVPLAPPGVIAHAAFMELANGTDAPVDLVGVSADGYAMAQIHETRIKDGIARMTGIDLITIEPGQRLRFAHGGLHVMLMQPETPQQAGATVLLDLHFADGTSQRIAAPVVPRSHAAGHSDGS